MRNWKKLSLFHGKLRKVLQTSKFGIFNEELLAGRTLLQYVRPLADRDTYVCLKSISGNYCTYV